MVCQHSVPRAQLCAVRVRLRREGRVGRDSRLRLWDVEAVVRSVTVWITFYFISPRKTGVHLYKPHARHSTARDD